MEQIKSADGRTFRMRGRNNLSHAERQRLIQQTAGTNLEASFGEDVCLDDMYVSRWRPLTCGCRLMLLMRMEVGSFPGVPLEPEHRCHLHQQIEPSRHFKDVWAHHCIAKVL